MICICSLHNYLGLLSFTFIFSNPYFSFNLFEQVPDIIAFPTSFTYKQFKSLERQNRLETLKCAVLKQGTTAYTQRLVYRQG